MPTGVHWMPHWSPLELLESLECTGVHRPGSPTGSPLSLLGHWKPPTVAWSPGAIRSVPARRQALLRPQLAPVKHRPQAQQDPVGFPVPSAHNSKFNGAIEQTRCFANSRLLQAPQRL
jgi:hypothetical protein